MEVVSRVDGSSITTEIAHRRHSRLANEEKTNDEIHNCRIIDRNGGAHSRPRSHSIQQAGGNTAAIGGAAIPAPVPTAIAPLPPTAKPVQGPAPELGYVLNRAPMFYPAEAR